VELSPTDDELVAAAQSGDRAALDALLRRHLDLIHAVCSRLARNPADAADATQEALIAIVRGLPRFDRRAAPRTWMYRVATNACLDELRRRGRRPRLGLDDAMAERPDPAPPVDRSVTDRLTLDDALSRLPDEFRVAVVLRDVQGMDYAQIAEVLQIPIGTVRSRIARGRKALAADLDGNQDRSGQRQSERP
jgi:RNA polymerase sigma-70 factor (ECF subfamily)